MSDQHEAFARTLVADVLSEDNALHIHPDDPHKVLAERGDGSFVSLDLTPFVAEPQPASAYGYFNGVQTPDDLLEAYHAAKKAKPFEGDLPGAYAHVDDYARTFLDDLLSRARSVLSAEEARRIARWVRDFDLYVAVKATESLLNSKADQALLRIAEQKGWTVHFDHLAIRCGSAARGDAERVVENLRWAHGYVPSQVQGEDYYQFEDGWNAYPLYKVLDNGQVLRLFIDQSDADHKTQIIQHWNYVYGYTAHHLGIRASRRDDGTRLAIPLPELMRTLQAHGIEVMTSTGEYTEGLLLQVFTRPERNRHIPGRIKRTLRRFGEELETVIENAKLLELLSRKEMKPALAASFYALYGLTFNGEDPLHSAPIYPYFLPAQAAHVIRTSVEE